MQILLVQRELINRCGSELFTIEVSRELSARGHQVTIYSPRVGDITKMVYGHGVQVKTRLSDIPWEPEIIHGHHHLHTMAAMARFENTPAVYFCHGPKPWVENAPLHPRIQSYRVNCPWMTVRIEAEFGIEKERIGGHSEFREPRPLLRSEKATRPAAPCVVVSRVRLFGCRAPRA